MRSVLMTIMVVLCLCASVQAAGWTVWGLTEQLTAVESDNSITARVGYFMGLGDTGGLEPFIGSVWRPRSEDTPQVITLGAVQHLPDLIDPNGPIPYISGIFTAVIAEEVVIRPYIGFQTTINLIDKDSGFIGIISGVTCKLTPDAQSEVVFEVSYDDTFQELAGVPDNELKGYIGFRIPF